MKTKQDEQVKPTGEKLTLSKTTVKDLTARTGIKAGGCAKLWTKHPQG